jgi:hypothetical protein
MPFERQHRPAVFAFGLQSGYGVALKRHGKSNQVLYVGLAEKRVVVDGQQILSVVDKLLHHSLQALAPECTGDFCRPDAKRRECLSPREKVVHKAETWHR